MKNIRLGHSSLSDKIYAGLVTKAGTWATKEDVTTDFITAAISRWSGFKETIEDSEGNQFQMTCKKLNVPNDGGSNG